MGKKCEPGCTCKRHRRKPPPKLEPIRCHIRWMIWRDMPEVLATEAAVFPFDKNEEDLLNFLRMRNVIGMVAEHEEHVVGHMIYELEKDRLHILRFAVHPNHRRRTVARQLVENLKSKLSSHRRIGLIIDVPESLVTLQQFLRGEGFKAQTVERGVFDGEDAYRMEFWIGEPEGAQPTNRITAEV